MNALNELININYEQSNKPTLSGRDLHNALEIETPYTIWIQRMIEYGFTEGVDYVTFLLDRIDGRAGKPKTDHQLTLDMAKELCMIQRSDKGRAFRQYFIEIEKSWNDPVLVMGRALEAQKKAAARLAETVAQLETKIEQDKPLIVFAGAVQTAQTSILIGDLAKILKQNGVNIGQKRLFEWLRQNGYLIKSGNSRNMPTQKAMELKLFEVKESTINNPDGSIRITKTTKVTGKGQTYFINKFLGDDDNGKT